jgi:hypothetical protein
MWVCATLWVVAQMAFSWTVNRYARGARSSLITGTEIVTLTLAIAGMGGLVVTSLGLHRSQKAEDNRAALTPVMRRYGSLYAAERKNIRQTRSADPRVAGPATLRLGELYDRLGKADRARLMFAAAAASSDPKTAEQGRRELARLTATNPTRHDPRHRGLWNHM